MACMRSPHGYLLQAHELQHQLVSVTAELGASKEVAAQRQKEIEKLTRYAAAATARNALHTTLSTSHMMLLHWGSG